MDWKGRRQSSNVDDRRGISGGKLAGGAGIVGLLIYLVVTFMGGGTPDVNEVLNQFQGTTPSGEKIELTEQQQELGKFVATVFADTEDVWHKIFSEIGKTYREPKMVLFTGRVATGCGNATSAVGPFYCPADEKIYMDLDFFEELKTRYGAKGGDFAIAYVIAHEVGHHVQNLLGINTKVRELQRGQNQKVQNRLSVCQELQADFLAGVFANYNKKYLEEGDIDEALSAASAVGDDAIQKKVRGQVVPDSFTHGTSKQREKWFLRGFTTGDINKGDTFAEEM